MSPSTRVRLELLLEYYRRTRRSTLRRLRKMTSEDLHRTARSGVATPGELLARLLAQEEDSIHRRGRGKALWTKPLPASLSPVEFSLRLSALKRASGRFLRRILDGEERARSASLLQDLEALIATEIARNAEISLLGQLTPSPAQNPIPPSRAKSAIASPRSLRKASLMKKSAVHLALFLTLTGNMLPELIAQRTQQTKRVRPDLSARDQKTSPAAAVTRETVPVIIWLEGQPLAEFHASQQPVLLVDHRPFRMTDLAVQQQRARLADSRREVTGQLAAMGFRQEGELDVVLHAVVGHLNRNRLEEAARLPGVRAVRPAKSLHLLMDGAVPLINALTAWPLLGGETSAGKGVMIAIIDTGIDINHPMLQDPTGKPPAGFPKGDATFTNGKVVVARNYVALLGEPRDTPSAIDRQGHGTFVAACAAGRRAVAPKATLTGVAPGAQLGNYRIFSSPLFTDPNSGGPLTNEAAILAAINDAVSDGMQIINISVGGLPGDIPSAEPLGQAVTNANKAGVLVVAAAGNDGDLGPATISEPADSPEALAAGASSNQRIFAQALQVTGPGTVPATLNKIAAVAGDGPQISAKLNLPLWAVSSEPCSTINKTTEKVQGAIALLRQGGFCSDLTRVRNATTAGAVAVILYDPSSSDDPFQAFGLSSTTIPTFSVSGPDGLALAAFFQGNTTNLPQVTVDSQISSVPVQPDRVASFSSIGPDIANQLKPELVAPGTSIYSAVQVNDFLGILYDPTGYFVADGTSFSSPITAGAAALVRQQHPTWTPAQAKSALVNTAANTARFGAQQSPLQNSGNGRLDVAAALQSTVAFQPTTLSFGVTSLSAPVNAQATFTMTNLGTAAETFTLDVVPRSTFTNGLVTLAKTSVTLAAQESTTVQLNFAATGSVSGHAQVDGRVRVAAVGSGRVYQVPYFGEVQSSSVLNDLFRVRGQGQIGIVGQALPQSLVAVVVDDEFKGVAGVPVTFKVSTGGGQVSAATVTTDFIGYASTNWTLGDAVGEQTVTVSAVGVSKIFYATARANPSITAAGAVNAATFTSTLAPGAMVSLFGTRMAASTASAASIPLPLLLGGAQVVVGGNAVPLYYVSPGQINFQMPYELQGQTTASLSVSVLGIATPAVSLPLSAAAPGLFTASQDGKGSVIALHSDNSPVTTANPAKAGETVVLYGVGLGPVTPAVASGAASPGSPAATTQTQATVKIGGNAATVSFSGLAPGFVGLYQVNVQIPAGTPAADQQLVLSVGTANSNTVTIPVR